MQENKSGCFFLNTVYNSTTSGYSITVRMMPLCNVRKSWHAVCNISAIYYYYYCYTFINLQAKVNYHTMKIVYRTPHETKNAEDETMPRYNADVQL